MRAASILAMVVYLSACHPHQYTQVNNDPAHQALAQCQYEAQRQMAQDNTNYGGSATIIEGNIVRSCMRAKGYR